MNCTPEIDQVAPCQPVASIGGDPDVIQQCAARSYHAGGVNVAFVDGHVTFVTDEVDRVFVWQPLSTIDGGEVFSSP